MLAERLRTMGVVGAGGAGFPTSAKAASRVELVIANGAECEPLIHKDVELMKHFPAAVSAGMDLMMKATGARRGKFGIKAKNVAAIDAIGAHIATKPVEMVLLGDFYPSGDEYELVAAATGRLIPPGGIPVQSGCVVNNVETLYNVHAADGGAPVTRKFVSIGGAVREPKSLWVPIGTSFGDLIALAGGAAIEDFAIVVSGLMMGSVSFDPADVVTKTTAGLVLLPRGHYAITRKMRPREAMHRIGKSACDQCTYCTEFCPRYLLGYEVMPHKVMRSLGFTATGADLWNQWGQLCCACGLCTLYACPEDLYPKEACDKAKIDLKAAGIRFTQQKPPVVHPMKEARHVPLAMLRRKLRVEEYERETPFEEREFEPARVRIKLSQHAGSPAQPVVASGDRVRKGAAVARVPASDLGADIHASINGTVVAVSDSFVEIVR